MDDEQGYPYFRKPPQYGIYGIQRAMIWDQHEPGYSRLHLLQMAGRWMCIYRPVDPGV